MVVPRPSPDRAGDPQVLAADAQHAELTQARPQSKQKPKPHEPNTRDDALPDVLSPGPLDAPLTPQDPEADLENLDMDMCSDVLDLDDLSRREDDPDAQNLANQPGADGFRMD